MDPALVPLDVTEALAELGMRAVAPAGPEGTGWLAVADDRTDRYVELHVVPVPFDDELARRLDLLRALHHPHLSELLDARELSAGRLALLVEHVPGLTLDELTGARAPLSDGEGVTLVVPILQALAALHGAGLVHGPVTASTVVARPDGRPVLTDLRGAVLGSGSVDGDVRRWLATVVGRLPGADLDALLPVPRDPTLREVLEPALRDDLDLDTLVRSCFAAAEPEGLRVPDPAVLAAGELTRQGARRGEPPTRHADRASRAMRAGRAPRPRRERGDRGGSARWTLGPRARAWLIGATVVSVVVTCAALVIGALGGEHGGERVATRPDAVRAAVDLSRARGSVLAAGDADALGSVEVPDGPAHAADVALVASWDGARMEGLAVAVRSATRAEPAGTDDAPRVEVTSAAGSYVRVDRDGGRTRVAAARERAVVLELRWTDDGWRVWAVSPS